MKKIPKSSSKYSLAFATMIAFSCVCTAGVSTFAWFQASSSVNIRTTQSSTSISVSKGIDYTLYAYVYNFQNGNSSNQVIGYSGSNATSTHVTGTFATDFVAVNSNNQMNITTSDGKTGFWPGKRITFCLAVSGITKTHAKLTLDSFTSDLADTSHATLARKVYTTTTTDTHIDVGWAMNLYGYAASSATDYSSFINTPATSGIGGDKLNYTPGTAIATKSSLNNVIVDSTSLTLSSGSTYIFYTIEFSNANTTWFEEVTNTGDHVNEEPESGTRYFRSSNNIAVAGSSCYSGLNFNLTSLSLTEADA